MTSLISELRELASKNLVDEIKIKRNGLGYEIVFVDSNGVTQSIPVDQWEDIAEAFRLNAQADNGPEPA